MIRVSQTGLERGLMAVKEIPTSEYAARRRKLLKQLKDGIGVVFAGEAQGDHFIPNPNFEYLTGITGEPGARLVLDPKSRSRKECLYLRHRDPDVERWDGERPEINSELKEETGIDSILRLGAFGRFMTEAASRSKRLVCLHPLAQPEQPVSPDLTLFRKIAERIPGVRIDDGTQLLPKLRYVKSSAEVDLIKRAAQITAEAYQRVFESLRPGLNEFEVQELLEHTYRSNGSRRTSYSTIVGGGRNGTVFHYIENSAPLQAGDLVVIDSAAMHRSYTADVTRTLPVSGRFSERQAELYNIVLKAQEAAIRACKPGKWFSDVDRVARKVIEEAGYGDRFPHGTGHPIGLEVHDSQPDQPLQEGAVVTIEPGIYIPEEGIGIRIEDDILVTEEKPINLTRMIPKRIVDLEKILTDHTKSKSKTRSRAG